MVFDMIRTSKAGLSDIVNGAYGKIKEIWVPYDRRKKYEKRAEKILSYHPEWAGLTEKEKKLAIYKEDYSQLIAFKNSWGRGKVLEKGFITDTAYQNILLPKLLHRMNYIYSRMENNNIYHDKNYFEILMPQLNFPEAVLRNVEGEFLTRDYKLCGNPLEILNQYDRLVFKGSIFSGSGRDIRLVEKKDYTNMLKKYGKDYIVQKPLKQSDFFSKWNASSVNIVRITTLLWKGELYNLGGIMKVGAPGGFCDQTSSKDGLHARFVGINEDGSLMDRAYDHDTISPCSDIWGNKVCGRIEEYKEMERIALREQERFPHHKILGWDFTVDSEGRIICIEFNARIPGMNLVQYALGPVLGRKTKRGKTLLEEMLHEAGRRK